MAGGRLSFGVTGLTVLASVRLIQESRAWWQQQERRTHSRTNSLVTIRWLFLYHVVIDGGIIDAVYTLLIHRTILPQLNPLVPVNNDERYALFEVSYAGNELNKFTIKLLRNKYKKFFASISVRNQLPSSSSPSNRCFPPANCGEVR